MVSCIFFYVNTGKRLLFAQIFLQKVSLFSLFLPPWATADAYLLDSPGAHAAPDPGADERWFCPFKKPAGGAGRTPSWQEGAFVSGAEKKRAYPGSREAGGVWTVGVRRPLAAPALSRRNRPPGARTSPGAIKQIGTTPPAPVIQSTCTLGKRLASVWGRKLAATNSSIYPGSLLSSR